MITVRHAEDRGRANFGWLDSKHTFSFGSYYDPKHMGFSELRVINDDLVQPNAGFDTHGHRDMEIISYVLEGVIAHKDSEGNVQTLPAGEFQLMSAGKGIYHSEYNASETDPLRFLQIWIQPNTFGNKPGYQQKDFGRNAGLTTIATPNGREWHTAHQTRCVFVSIDFGAESRTRLRHPLWKKCLRSSGIGRAAYRQHPANGR